MFKEAKFIETLAGADTIIFDKTGTLTEGNLTVINSPKIDTGYLNILYTLSSSSNHPVSVAVKRYLEKNYSNLELVELNNINQLSGMGIEAEYDSKLILGGNIKLMNSKGINYKGLDGYTDYLFAIDNKVIYHFKLEDKIRDGAYDLISYLKSINLNVVMATGDKKEVAKKVAKKLGIDEVKAELSPFDKLDFIENLKKGKKTIVMVGDGINDTLALSKADISIVMGSGADIALSVSDIVILNNSLKSIKYSIFISKRTFKFIKQNLAISLLYNSITIPIAVAGYVIPLIASLSMSFSSLLVVGNSMRIRLKEID